MNTVKLNTTNINEKLLQYEDDDIENCLDEISFYKQTTLDTLSDSVVDYIGQKEWNTISGMCMSISNCETLIKLLVDLKEIRKTIKKNSN